MSIVVERVSYSVSDHFLDEKFHVAELPVAGLVLHVVGSKLMKLEKLFQLFTRVEAIPQGKNIVGLAMCLKVRDLFIGKNVGIW